MKTKKRTKVRVGTAAEATAGNVYLQSGELGIESDTYKAKLGPGNWNSLPYIPWSEGDGFLNPMTTKGDVIYSEDNDGTPQRLGIGSDDDILTSDTGVPSWKAPQALSKTDDTNIGLTLSGTIAKALLKAVLITVNWIGQLAVGRGGTGQSSFTAYTVLCGGNTSSAPLQNVSGTGSTGQYLKSMGAGALPQWADLPSVSLPTYTYALWVDATAGDDATGSLGRFDKPFKTLSAAKSAAVAGTLCFVMPGAYTSTVTIAKDGIGWYFYPGASVSITGSQTLFDHSGFSTGCNVYGYGDFSTASTGKVWSTINKAYDQRFEFGKITATVSSPIEMSFGATMAYTGVIKGSKITTTNGVVIYLSYGGTIWIECPWVETTHNNASSHAIACYNGNQRVYVNSEYVASTHASSYGIVGIYNSTWFCNVGYCTGYHFVEYATVTFNGYSTKVLGNAGYAAGGGVHNGDIGSLSVTGAATGFTVNGRVTTLTVSAGSVYVGAVTGYGTHTLSGGGGRIKNGGGLFWSISGGSWTIDHGLDGADYFQYSITGTAKVTFNMDRTSSYYYTYFIVNGASCAVNINGSFKTLSSYYSYYNGMIRFIAGTLTINATLSTTYTGVEYPLIGWEGGTLIIDKAKFYVGSVADTPPIVSCPTSAQDLRNIITATNFTGDEFTSRKGKCKHTVNAVATTTIVLNDGSGGNETFTETDTTTYNTKALMAQRMAALINASGTLDITASQDTPGTDIYFYTELDVAASQVVSAGNAGYYNAYPVSGVNLTGVTIRLGHKAPTNKIGSGVWIEDTDVL